MRNLYKILVRKPEGKNPLRRCRHTCEDNFRMDLREMGGEVVDLMSLAQYRDQWWAVMNAVMSFQVQKKVRNFLSSLITVSSSTMTILHGAS
jgi:archaellum biogenesis ATPase FlaH